MKKFSLIFLSILVLLGICGCNNNNNDNIKKFTAVDKNNFPFDTIDTEQQFFDVLNENNNIVLAVKDTCEYSKKFSPIVKEVADTYNLKVYTLNVDSLDNWTLNNKKSEEVITIEATPTLFIKNKNIEKIEGFYEKQELINILQTKNIIEDKRTAKEKIVEYLEKNKSAICDDTKCTYSFTTPGYFSDTTYYTLDFVNKKFYNKSYNYGSTYIEYNYGNNTGYAKQVNTVGWTTTTEVWLTYNDANNTYNWTCNSDLNGSCEATGNSIAEMTDRKRTELYDICNKLGIKANEI